MNKASVVVLAIFATLVISTYSAPLEEDFDVDELEEQAEQEEVQEDHHVRVRRATCDLLSFEIKGFKLNHAACAAHCIARGKRGGRCNGNRVCVCRR